MDNYKAKIAKIGRKLQKKTLGEVQAEMKTSRIDYTGVGFGYQLKGKLPKTREEAEKFIRTPEYDKLMKAIEV